MNMSVKNDIIALNEVVKQTTDLLREQSTSWKSIVDEIKKINQSAPSSYIKMQKDLSVSIQQAEKAEQQYLKTMQQKQVLEQKVMATERSKIQLSEASRRANERAVKSALEQNSAYLKLQNSWRQAQRTYADLLATVGTTPQVLNKARAEFEKLDKQIKSIDTATKNYSKNVGNYGSALKGVSGLTSELAGALGWAGALSTVVSLGKSFYDTTKQLEGLHKAMQLGAKDAETYNSNVDFLKRITEDYGLELISTSRAFNKFYIAAKDSMSLSNIQMIFDKVSKSASLMGISVYEQEGIFKALEQMMSKGTVQAEELRGQLGDRLPGAFNTMAKAMGVTTAQLGDMMKNGEVMSAEVLPKFAIELEKAFGAEQVKKVDNLAAAEVRLKNAWTNFIIEMNEGNSVVSTVSKNFLNWITHMLSGLRTIITLAGGVSEAFRVVGATAFGMAQTALGFSDTITLALTGNLTKAKEMLKKNVGDMVNVFKQGRDSINAIIKNTSNSLLGSGNINGFGTPNFWEETPSPTKTNGNDDDNKKKEDAVNKQLELDYKLANQLIENQIKVTKSLTEQMTLRQQQVLLWYAFEVAKAKGNQKEIEVLNAELTGKLIDLNNEEVKAIDSKNDKRTKAEQKTSELVKKAWKGVTDYIKEQLDKQVQAEQEATNKRREGFKDYAKGGFSFSSFGFDSLDIFQDQKFMEDFWKTMGDDSVSGMEKAAAATRMFGEIAKDVFNNISERQNAYYERQFANLEKEKEVALQFAGESTAGREAIEKQYEEKKAALQREQAKKQKQMAIFSAIINIAQGITASLAQGGPAGIILAALVGVLGAVQIASIASTPLPAFEKGTQNAPEGWAITQEKGAEMITDKNGNIKTLGNNKGNQLTYLNKGDKVYTADETTQRINEMLLGTGVAPIVNTNVNSGLTEEQLERVMNKTLSKQPQNSIIFDEHGIRAYQNRENSRTKLKNRNVKL